MTLALLEFCASVVASDASDYAGVGIVHMIAFGGPEHRELWIPADELDRFNRHIVGPIRVVRSFGEDAG